MKGNKGFTLVELLAVIVILGVLLGVTTVAVSNIKKKQDRKNYENVISSILTGAKKYVTDNNGSEGYVDVDTLLVEGYVDFDRNEFSEFVSKKVAYAICDGSIKRNFSIEAKDESGNSKTYNDCGCETQEEGDSAILCNEDE